MRRTSESVLNTMVTVSIAAWSLWQVDLTARGQSINVPLTADGDYSINVDYRKSLAGMIRVGKYDYVANEVTSDHFAVEGHGKVAVKLVVLSSAEKLSIADVLAGFDQLGYRPATLPELLALGAQYPNLQRKFTMVEFGTLWTNDAARGVRVAAYLRGTERGVRALDIYFVDPPPGAMSARWVSGTRFLAARR